VRDHRGYIGPAEDFDLIAALSFNLLTTLGLRQKDRLLDVGCGSLRLGRLFIPYLHPDGYTGVEPQRWLVDAGIEKEVGADQIALKRPRFVYADNAGSLQNSQRFEFAVAQSIFSHAARSQVGAWLRGIAAVLAPSGILAATFVEGASDYTGAAWVYPGCIQYRAETMRELSTDAGLRMELLDWPHPRQTWALFLGPQATVPAAVPRRGASSPRMW
jgi:cyclopropane fatty-acyl-phospholipid synthase-like methyltransferase